MSLDYNKTLDFVKGYTKMCNARADCDACPLLNLGCSNIECITQTHIDAVKAWNDEHREKTRAEVLKELIPEADVYELCPNRFFGYRDSFECNRTDCYGCKQEFWSALHKETEAAQEGDVK